MNIKKETGDIVEFLKENGYSRRQIEKDLAYKEKYIDQALSRGDSEELLIRLRFYKKYVLLKTTSSSAAEPGPQASLKELVRAHQELSIVVGRIQKRIYESNAEETDSLIDEKPLNMKNKDSRSKKRRSGKE